MNRTAVRRTQQRKERWDQPCFAAMRCEKLKVSLNYTNQIISQREQGNVTWCGVSCDQTKVCRDCMFSSTDSRLDSKWSVTVCRKVCRHLPCKVDHYKRLPASLNRCRSKLSETFAAIDSCVACELDVNSVPGRSLPAELQPKPRPLGGPSQYSTSHQYSAAALPPPHVTLSNAAIDLTNLGILDGVIAGQVRSCSSRTWHHPTSTASELTLLDTASEIYPDVGF